MVEVINTPKFYETIENNKVLDCLSDEDFITVTNYFNERFPIYYMEKKNYKLERKDLIKYEAEEYYVFVNPLCRKDIFNGRIDNIKNLCDKNFNFLNHMFRFNSTLTAFSEILEKGHFEVLEQYSAKDVWNYFKEVHYSYTEKKGNYIGSMESKSKLDYFPTNYEIQYKALPYITRVVMRDSDFIRKSTKNFINKYIGDKYSDEIYVKLIEMGRFDIIDEVFRIAFSENEKVVISDLFAGEGEWLNIFKKMAPNKNLYILANEIEQNRFLQCKNKKFNNVIWGAYEELEDKVPKKFVDIMLFNPPYGETDGERNVIRFLNMLIKDKYLESNGKIIIVINENDLKLSLERIVENFDVTYAFKFTNGKEAERLKQVCLIGKNRGNFSLTSRYNIDRELDRVNRLLEKEYEANLNTFFYFGGKNINERFDAFNVFKNPNMYKSSINSEGWKELINDVVIDTFQGKTVKLAERPRNLGAAANLISSGLINGEIEGEHEHCIAAGITEQIIKTIDHETGNILITKQSAPFLSVLTGGNIVEITKNNSDRIDIQDDGTVIVA